MNVFQNAVTSPLEKYSVFASTRLDEVVHNVASAYCPHKLLLNDRGSQVNARYHRLPLRDTSLNFLQYGADVAINIGPFAEFYMLELPLAGKVRLQYGDRDYINRPGSPAVAGETWEIALVIGLRGGDDKDRPAQTRGLSRRGDWLCADAAAGVQSADRSVLGLRPRDQ